jgi:diguanylate cyclase (GGDEF)-like protein/PAS domain S-box-containing protein
MSFPNPPQAQDAQATTRQRIHAGLEAIAVLLTSMAGVVLAVFRGDDHPEPAHLVGAGLITVVAVLIAALVYRRRCNAYVAARAMADQQERLTAVVEGTGVGLWEAHLDANLVYGSVHWALMIGLTHDPNVPMQVGEWRRLVHPEDLSQVNKVMLECIRLKDLFQLEFRLRHAEGHWVWVVSRGTVTDWSPDGRPLRVVGTQRDITSRKVAELALEESERKFRSLFERSPVGIALTDYKTRRFLQVNDAFLEPGGYSREEILATTYDMVAVSNENNPLNQATGQRERLFRRKDGRFYPVMISGICMTDSTGREVVWSVVQDISHRKSVERELAAAARRDRLTGLANRTLFLERLQEAVGRVRDGSQAMFAVLFLDFDRFKVINDAMGHQAGDELLVQIAERLRKALRSSDTNRGVDSSNQIARFGGDEFLVLINDIDKQQDAARIADRVLVALAHPYNIQGREVHSTASIGIVTSDHCMEGAETIIRNADVAMYEAKRAGRACSIFFNDDMHTRLSRKLMIETSLRKAIGTDQLSLVYQSIVELDTGKRSSVEALLRWKHPTLGQISPAEFIPVAEESGLINQVGEWVMRESCSALARWQKIDPERAPRVVSVNVSRAELAQGARLLRCVRESLAAAALPPESLQLEVTEREVMRDPDASLVLMHQLREAGVRLAMDDFGTGTSSLGCLRDYPFDVIKIDRSFVTDLAAGPDTLAVIHATITLVENLGKCSVAEGVETAEQLAILQSLGCHYAQGYFLGYPLPESEVVDTERTVLTPRLRMA